ncbi:bifunctional diguanylate cyclase/phosphodiesterase [Sphingomonas sp. So64.6b]|uniref:putative bifunctional diguanylate cyclase/phosphodiesterase n=1 Tax=Sphingomonas sp. So64.6b TaxID=2997354 RepID=UPI001602D41C|nr:bifunctional diguanylate cyclase/phosphodiesterase [Sphingomonas sp. So64.6b]QNA83982.1 bifunctional diguanylate cyclase/phosphodiesterase [Sphingomonas sp. So64.6b]
MTEASLAPLYILSFRQRDELAAIAADAGWHVVAARRVEGAERRFLGSGAPVAVIDARGSLAEGLEATAALGGAIGSNGGAMLALVSRGDIDAIGRFYDAGATHFLASPFSEAEFVQALRFAARHADRMAGEWQASGPADPLGWRLDLRSRAILLTPGLARLLDLDEEPSPRTLLRKLDKLERRAAIAALRRLAGARHTTAFAHDLTNVGRVVQHLQLDEKGGRIDALVEPLGSAPDSVAAMRDALALSRDAGGARRWIERRLARSEQGAADGSLTVILVALNRFGIVNTAYGRSAGDGLLRGAHRRIEEVARETLERGALVARMGGSEYLIATAAPRERIDLAVEHIAGALARPFVVGESIVVLGCRIGMAERSAEDDAAKLLRRASEALADAKASDSATVRVAEAGESDAPIDRLASQLRQAIEQGDIDILFQPQVSVSTGEIVGVEALARWDHAVLGTIGADALFAAAARADLEIGLSDHIQRIVMARAAAWPAALAGLRLSLNLTAGDIARPGFADLFLDRIDASGFPRKRLTLEITESGLIEDLGVASTLLATLRSAGCRIAIDDFGTGYSSLAYLKSLPLDYLKIDKKLAQDIAGTARDRVVVRGVIDMARSLGLSVIAEGVETTEQLDLLAKEGCQYYQGFLCSEPVDVDALLNLMAGRT